MFHVWSIEEIVAHGDGEGPWGWGYGLVREDDGKVHFREILPGYGSAATGFIHITMWWPACRDLFLYRPRFTHAQAKEAAQKVLNEQEAELKDMKERQEKYKDCTHPDLQWLDEDWGMGWCPLCFRVEFGDEKEVS